MAWVYIPLPRACVYLLRAENGYVKIGASFRPQYRAMSIGGMSPIPVTLIGAWDVQSARETERKLHSYYAPLHVKNEWFDLGDSHLRELITWLDRIGTRATDDKVQRE